MLWQLPLLLLHLVRMGTLAVRRQRRACHVLGLDLGLGLGLGLGLVIGFGIGLGLG